jgi:hypothetical protein
MVFFSLALASALILVNSMKPKNDPNIMYPELDIETNTESSCSLAYKNIFNSTDENNGDITAVQYYCPGAQSTCCSSQQLEDLSEYAGFVKNLYKDILDSDEFYIDEDYFSCITDMISMTEDYVCFACDNNKKLDDLNIHSCSKVSPETMKQSFAVLLKSLKENQEFLKYKKKFPVLSEVFKSLYASAV